MTETIAPTIPEKDQPVERPESTVAVNKIKSDSDKYIQQILDDLRNRDCHSC